MLDLDAYLARIGYRGTPKADLATLRALHALHPVAIPFENLDPLLGRPVSLEIGSLQRKMVRSRRGGYCFEQNILFQAVLQRLGYEVTALAARVLWMTPPDAAPNPRAHMVLKVDLEEGPYIADVGFGGSVASAPVALTPDLEQPQLGGTARFVRIDGFYILQVTLASVWQDVYRFTLEPQLPIDFEVANWYTSTNPKSRFRTNLIVQRLTSEGRISLLNRHFTCRYLDGGIAEALVTGPQDLVQTLRGEFGIEAPVDAVSLYSCLPRG